MQLREKTSLWSFQSVEADPALTGVQVRKLLLSTSTSCHSPPSPDTRARVAFLKKFRNGSQITQLDGSQFCS